MLVLSVLTAAATFMISFDAQTPDQIKDNRRKVGCHARDRAKVALSKKKRSLDQHIKGVPANLHALEVRKYQQSHDAKFSNIPSLKPKLTHVSQEAYVRWVKKFHASGRLPVWRPTVRVYHLKLSRVIQDEFYAACAQTPGVLVQILIARSNIAVLNPGPCEHLIFGRRVVFPDVEGDDFCPLCALGARDVYFVTGGVAFGPWVLTMDEVRLLLIMAGIEPNPGPCTHDCFIASMGDVAERWTLPFTGDEVGVVRDASSGHPSCAFCHCRMSRRPGRLFRHLFTKKPVGLRQALLREFLGAQLAYEKSVPLLRLHIITDIYRDLPRDQAMQIAVHVYANPNAPLNAFYRGGALSVNRHGEWVKLRDDTALKYDDVLVRDSTQPCSINSYPGMTDFINYAADTDTADQISAAPESPTCTVACSTSSGVKVDACTQCEASDLRPNLFDLSQLPDVPTTPPVLPPALGVLDGHSFTAAQLACALGVGGVPVHIESQTTRMIAFQGDNRIVGNRTVDVQQHHLRVDTVTFSNGVPTTDGFYDRIKAYYALARMAFKPQLYIGAHAALLSLSTPALCRPLRALGLFTLGVHVAVRCAQFLMWLFKPNQTISYVPHMVTQVASELPATMVPADALVNVRPHLRRLAPLPVPDADMLLLTAGTERILVGSLTNDLNWYRGDQLQRYSNTAVMFSPTVTVSARLLSPDPRVIYQSNPSSCQHFGVCAALITVASLWVGCQALRLLVQMAMTQLRYLMHLSIEHSGLAPLRLITPRFINSCGIGRLRTLTALTPCPLMSGC